MSTDNQRDVGMGGQPETASAEKALPRFYAWVSRVAHATARQLAEKAPRLGWNQGKRVMKRQLQTMTGQKEEVATFIHAVESRFLEIGRLLQQQVARSDELLGASERFTQVQQNMVRDGSAMTAAVTLTHEALASLEAGQQQTETLRRELEAQRMELARVQRSQADWQQVLTPLKLVQTLFRIESANLPAEAQGFFKALTDGIASLHKEVTSVLAEQFEALASTRKNLEALLAHLQDRAKKQTAGLAHREQLRASLAALEKQVQENSAWHGTVAEEARALASHISQVVVALQFQDIVRQKAEHVLAALDQIQATGTPGVSMPPGAGPVQNVPMACRLQAGQLRSMRNELDQAVANVSQGLRQILHHLDRMQTQTLSSVAVRQMHEAIEQIARVSQQALRDTEQLLAEMVEGLEVTHRVTAQFGDIAAHVTRTVRRLAADIRLTALNAQVQATRINTVTGLEVLTEFTRQLSQETDRFSLALGEDIGKLSSGLATIASRCIQERDQFRAGHEQFARQASAHRQQLESYQAEAQQALRGVAEQLARIATEAHSTLPGTNLEDLDTGRLENLEQTLEKLAQTAGGNDASRSASTADGFTQWEQQYTMESERQIHAAVLAEQALPKPELTRLSLPVGRRAKVEKPCTPAREPAASSLPEPSSTPAAAPELAVVTQPTQPSNPLGDNVELF